MVESIDYITVPADHSLHVLLKRLSVVLPELKDLSASHEVKVFGRKGQGMEGSKCLVFINGPENQRNVCQHILDNLGFFTPVSGRERLNLDELPIEDVDSLINLARDVNDNYQPQFDSMTSEFAS